MRTSLLTSAPLRSALRAFALCVLCFLCVLVNPSAQTGIRIGVLSGGTHTVTVLPLDTYVARVLAGEAAPNTAPAALEALAIAVRTYTAANMGKHRSEGFDLCDQTHCQVMRVANNGYRAGIAGDGRTGAARRHDARDRLLQRVVRRPDRGPLGGLAGVGGSALPAVS